MGHAMIFSAAEATEEAYRGITNNGENPLLLGIINVLGKDYSNIYSVDCATHKIQICRFHNHVLGRVNESLICEEPYERVMDIYIEDNVASEDQTRMRQMILKRSFWLLPMKIWMFSPVKWNPFWNQVDRPPEESFL